MRRKAAIWRCKGCMPVLSSRYLEWPPPPPPPPAPPPAAAAAAAASSPLVSPRWCNLRWGSQEVLELSFLGLHPWPQWFCPAGKLLKVDTAAQKLFSKTHHWKTGFHSFFSVISLRQPASFKQICSLLLHWWFWAGANFGKFPKQF